MYTEGQTEETVLLLEHWVLGTWLHLYKLEKTASSRARTADGNCCQLTSRTLLSFLYFQNILGHFASNFSYVTL